MKYLWMKGSDVQDLPPNNLVVSWGRGTEGKKIGGYGDKTRLAVNW